MKKQITHFSKTLCLMLLFLLANCQKDDQGITNEIALEQTAKSTTKTVSGVDIPGVINFLETKTNGRLQFLIDDTNSEIGQNRSHEDNLVLTNAMTDEITQVTNSYGKSNYTFKLIEETDKTGVYFLNLVVKEYKDSFYLYIVKYVPDSNWLKSYTDQSAFSAFTGAMYFYSDQGTYIAKIDMENGVSTGMDRHPCDNGNSSNSGGNSGSNTGQGDSANGDDASGSGSGTTSGTGNGDTTSGNGDTNSGSGDGDTSATGGEGSGGGHGDCFEIEYYWDEICGCQYVKIETCDENHKSMSDMLRHPCDNLPDECYDAVGDPCPNGCNANGDGCAETNDDGGGDGSDENNDVGVSSNLTDLIEAFNSFVNTLSFGQHAWVDDPVNSDIRTKFMVFLDSSNFSNDAKDFVKEMIEYAHLNNSSDEAINGINMTLAVIENQLVSGPYDSSYYSLINQFSEADLNDSAVTVIWAAQFSIRCAILRIQNPSWSDLKIYWEASKEMIHLGLDLAGLVPGIGEVCDVLNGVMYTVEGDGVNASLSFAGAIPFAGWLATGSKFAYKGSLKFIVKADNLINFGNRSGLRTVLGITDSGTHAHHIVPWALGDHPLVQKAASSIDAFHMNEALNGIPRSTSLHQTGHHSYNSNILGILNDNADINDVNEAYNFVEGLANHIRNLIEVNPNLNSGQISDLISYP